MNESPPPRQPWAEPTLRLAQPSWRGVHIPSASPVTGAPFEPGGFHAAKASPRPSACLRGLAPRIELGDNLARANRPAALPTRPGPRRATRSGNADQPAGRAVRRPQAMARRRLARWVERGVLAMIVGGMLLAGASFARAVQAERMSPSPAERISSLPAEGPRAAPVVLADRGAEPAERTIPEPTTPAPATGGEARWSAPP
jgi:hypothetical protein